MSDKVKFLAISGSLRKASINTAFLRAAQALAPASMTIELYEDLGKIPPYDNDVWEQGFPPVVDTLRERIRAADGLILATPEYNRSFSGVLKNALDWVSRPPSQPFSGKAVLVTGVAGSSLGTGLANYQLRQTMSAVDAHVLPGAEVLVGGAHDKFGPDGVLTHEATREFLGKALARLERLARQLAHDPDAVAG